MWNFVHFVLFVVLVNLLVFFAHDPHCVGTSEEATQARKQPSQSELKPKWQRFTYKYYTHVRTTHIDALLHTCTYYTHLCTYVRPTPRATRVLEAWCVNCSMRPAMSALIFEGCSNVFGLLALEPGYSNVAALTEGPLKYKKCSQKTHIH